MNPTARNFASSSRARLSREERRSVLLAAALDVFARQGYHAASVSDIIDKAGVARGTFYLYFESKRSLFDELLDDLLALLERQVVRIDDSQGPQAVVEQIRVNVAAVLGCLLANRPMLRIILAEAVGLDAGFDHKLAEFYRRLTKIIQGSLELGMAMKLIRPIHTQVVSQCILGSIKEVLSQVSLGEEPLPKEVLVEEILRYNVRGLFVPEVAESLGMDFTGGKP